MGRVQSRRRIALIVEDDAELRLLTTMVLEESELDIIECESAEAALATMLLRGQNVAMIFADIRLMSNQERIGLEGMINAYAGCSKNYRNDPESIEHRAASGKRFR
jgi:DNA-binding NtrC family response regulator